MTQVTVPLVSDVEVTVPDAGGPRESDLYLPVKAFLEGLGFSVKGEIGDCDLLALKGDEPPIVVICELKLAFNLELVLQGVDRACAADEVWLAARLSKRGGGREGDARFRQLCRRLGFGLLAVEADGRVHLLVGADAAMPRRDSKRRSRLVAEHRRREGDPAVGGGSRQPIMTAYRQGALRCAALLAGGAKRLRDLTAKEPAAGKIVSRNVYGWFARAERGWYVLTPKGQSALGRWPTIAPVYHQAGSLEDAGSVEGETKPVCRRDYATPPAAEPEGG